MSLKAQGYRFLAGISWFFNTSIILHHLIFLNCTFLTQAPQFSFFQRRGKCVVVHLKFILQSVLEYTYNKYTIDHVRVE